ncbi:MAG: hypothetical protein ABR511_07650 [Acidimicrobiales bacterium]
MKDIFGGRGKGRSKEDIEREAQREIERLTRNAGPRPGLGGGGGGGGGGLGAFGGAAGGPPAFDEVVSRTPGRSMPAPGPRPPAPDPHLGGGLGPSGAPRFGGVPSSGPGAPPPTLGSPDDYTDDAEDAEDESASITEMALRDHAARFGTDPENLVIRQDPFTAEQMRDEAMRRFMHQQESRHARPESPSPRDPVSSVLDRLAARRAAEEEARAAGEADGEAGVLDRIRARREAVQAEQEPEPVRRARPDPGSPLSRLQSREALAPEGADDGGGDALASMRARVMQRRSQPRRPAPAAAPPPDEGEDDLSSPTDFEAVVSRLSHARPSRPTGASSARRLATGRGSGPPAPPAGRRRSGAPDAPAAAPAKPRRPTRAAGGAGPAKAAAASKDASVARRRPAADTAGGRGATKKAAAVSKRGGPRR